MRGRGGPAFTLLLAGCGESPSAPDPTSQTDSPEGAVTAASAGSGGITIVLDMQPNREVDLAYATSGKKLRNFTLDDDRTSALPSSRTCTRLKPGSYTVQQGAADEVTLEDIACQSTPNGGSGTENNTIDLVNRRVTIQLERDEAVTCTFGGNQPIWEEGDFVTWTQGDWGDDPALNLAAALIDLRFIAAYPGGTLEVGIPGTA
jgi:hypothetical protein